jgi:hypothetical protein
MEEIVRLEESQRNNSTMEIKASELARVIIEYAGPSDDPNIGWCGGCVSHPDLFRCERCGAEHLDGSKIEHKPGCTAAKMLAVLRKLQTIVEIVPTPQQPEGE